MIKSFLSCLKAKMLYLGIIRYVLGAFMLTYSITKILKTQFALPGFVWTELQTLETLNSKQLAWAFLGYSSWFQVLMGILELIPAILLLFKRTTLAGASLMLPVTLNVVLINYSLKLWDGTKILSSILLLLNLLIFIFMWDRIKLMFEIVIRGKFSRVESVINSVLIIALSYFALHSLLTNSRTNNDFTGDWLNQHPIEWTLEREECKDSIFVKREAKIYFWGYGIYKEVGGSEEDTPTTYSIDEQKHELILKFNNGESLKCNYSFITKDQLEIQITKNQSKITQYYKKRIINQDRN